MVVLSLFDGISCGQLALKRAGFNVEAYYASEIEDSAQMIALKNFPDTVEIGDVTKVSFKDGVLMTERGVFNVGKVDVLLGGSPCTDFSFIGYALGMQHEGVQILTYEHYKSLKDAGAEFTGQSYLFWEYVRLLKEVSPDYFLLENVLMAPQWEKVITDALEVMPVRINSSLVSAQNRPRLYWTNIPGVTAPEDKGIKLDDILDPDAPTKDVCRSKLIKKALPKIVTKYGYIPERFNAYNLAEIKYKACALSRGSMVTSSCATLILVQCKRGSHKVVDGIMDDKYPVRLPDGRYNVRRLDFTEMERLQTLPDGYTNVESIGKQKRSATIGNCWTVDVVAYILSRINEDTSEDW